MNGKPKNFRALMLAVLCARHPELEGSDRALLATFAANATISTGRDSRPGNAMLMTAASLGATATDGRLKKLIRLTLIERTFTARGRNLASVYRLCLENPVYPDRAVSGEWLLDSPDPKTPCLERALNPENDRHDEEEHSVAPAKTPSLERALSSENARHDDGKRPPEGSKTPAMVPENARPSAGHTKYSQRAHQPPTSQTSSSSENELAGWEGWLHKTATIGIGVPTAGEVRELKMLARRGKFGFDFLKRAVHSFGNCPQGLDGLKNPWRMFLSQAATYIGSAKTECMESFDWRMANDSAYRKLQDASVARQMAENLARMMAVPAENEMYLEDFLG